MENIIGLTRTQCECFDVEANESDSGLWLDELEGLNLKMIEAGTYCEELGEFMAKARGNAIASFKADVLANLRNYYRPRYDAFVGLLGQEQGTKYVTPSTDFAGAYIKSKIVKGSYLKIKRIGININESKTVEIKGYFNGEEILDEEIEIQSEANKWKYTELEEHIILDLWKDGYNKVEYLLGYFPEGEKYRDNKTDCGCSRKSNLENFIEFKGAFGTIESYSKGDNAHGLVFDVEIICESDSLIEDNIIYPDYKLVSAHAVRYKAGFYLSQYILTSGNTNIYTVVNPEQLFANAQGYEKEYQDRVKGWLPENTRINNDCYICNKTKMGRILS
jgi:hypothetical protein